MVVLSSLKYLVTVCLLSQIQKYTFLELKSNRKRLELKCNTLKYVWQEQNWNPIWSKGTNIFFLKNFRDHLFWHVTTDLRSLQKLKKNSRLYIIERGICSCYCLAPSGVGLIVTKSQTALMVSENSCHDWFLLYRPEYRKADCVNGLRVLTLRRNARVTSF